MTEAEAKTKWCPFVRLAETPGSYNRRGPLSGLECIASACMGWRWREPQIGDGGGHPTERRGFCGIAGRT